MHLISSCPSRLSPRLLVALLALCAVPVLAREATLPPVHVTATLPASPTIEPLETARKRLSAIPGGANVVDAEQYREGRVSTLPDALQFAPGVYAASRFGAEEARLSIRGSGLQRTFHMRGILLLQDGVPLNLADGSADFQAVEPLAARYVEVLRGANALQYGAATLGGAVNFVSPSGLIAPGASLRSEAGSHGYRRLQLAAGGHSSDEALDWFIAASGFRQDGYRAHARQDTRRLSVNLGLSVSDALETRFFLSSVRSNSELPGALTRSEMAAGPRAAAPAAVAGDQHRDFDLYRLSNKTTLRLQGGQRLEFGAYYARKSLFHPIFQVLQQDSDDAGLSLRYLAQDSLFGRPNQLSLGASLTHGRLEDERFVNLAGRPGARTGQSRQRSQNHVLFVENQHMVLPTTALIAGMQVVHSKRGLHDAFLADGNQSVVAGYTRASPKLGVRHDLGPDTQFFANVSGSHEPPTFGELSGGANVTPVAAQRAQTLEIGTRGLWHPEWGSLRWDLSLYRAQLRDELLALNDANGTPLGTRNAGRTLHQGIESGLEASIGARWTARAAWQLNDFRFQRDPVYRGNRLAGIPRHVASAELLYRPGRGFYLGPNLRLASSTYIDHANSLWAPGHGLVGFKIGQQVNPRLSWFFDARNLADKVHVATTGVIADAQGADSRQFYPGDGRSLYAGIELKY